MLWLICRHIDHGFRFTLYFPSASRSLLSISCQYQFCRLSLFSAAATSFSVCIVNSISKKTSKSAQHLLHLMRLMTIIDRSSNSTQPQSLQSQKHQPIHFDWLVRAHQHFYDGRFNEARPHISTIESLLTVYANYFYCYS